MTLEERQIGTVALRIWWEYMLSCGLALSMIVIAIYLSREAAKVTTDFWVKNWASSTTDVTTGNSSDEVFVLGVLL